MRGGTVRIRLMESLGEEDGAMHGRRYFFGIICLAVLLLTASGCSRMTADDLYSLPQVSKEYLKLQEQINTVLASGSEYSPPTAGPNRQSVQLKDLDNDGINEAIAFFRTTGDKPLKIYIIKQVGAAYQTADVIEGDGTAIESIRYADLDGDGVSELIIGWQMGASLLHMTIYSIRDNQHVLLAGADYTELTLNDLDNDGKTDVVALRLPSSGLPGEAEMFSLKPDGEVVSSKTRLSKGIESITSVFKGALSDGKPAVFVEGGYGGSSVITDILSWKNNSICNVSVNVSGGFSEKTVRSYAVYSADINKDGVMDVPSPRLLKSASTAQYYIIDWFSYDSYGNRSKVFTTYHNFSDGWYLILPDDWKDKITIRREDAISGERTLIFSYKTGAEESPIDFLKIYRLSGDNKDDRAKLPGRIKLLENGDTIYAAEILPINKNITINSALLLSGFKLIYSDWTTGVS